MPGKIGEYASNVGNYSVQFDLKQLKKHANGDYNMGELLLGTDGKLVHVNSKVWKTDQNHVVSTGEQNRTVRSAISDVLTKEYDNAAATKVVNYLLDEENANLPLSRDEMRKLLELCEAGKKHTLTDLAIKQRLDLIGSFAELKRERLTEGALSHFVKELNELEAKDNDIGSWVKGLSLVSAKSKGYKKKIYNSIVSQSESQRYTPVRNAIQLQCEDLIRQKFGSLEREAGTGKNSAKDFVEELENFYALPGDDKIDATPLIGKDSEDKWKDGKFRKAMVFALKGYLEDILGRCLRERLDEILAGKKTSDDGVPINELVGRWAKTGVLDSLYEFRECKTVGDVVNRMKGLGLDTAGLEEESGPGKTDGKTGGTAPLTFGQVIRTTFGPLENSLNDNDEQFLVKLKDLNRTVIDKDEPASVRLADNVVEQKKGQLGDRTYRKAFVAALTRYVRKNVEEELRQHANGKIDDLVSRYYVLGMANLMVTKSVPDIVAMMENNELRTDDLKGS